MDFTASFVAPPRESLVSAARFFPESMSRLRRERSVLRSVAVWWRRLRSFSRALSRMRESSGGSAGFTCAAGSGSRFRIASKTTADVSPGNGSEPVAIW